MLTHTTLAKFISKRSGETYLVKQHLKTSEISCNCKGWIYRRKCKHLTYLANNGYFAELTDIPTRAEAELMSYGDNLEEKEKWTVEHLKPIEL